MQRWLLEPARVHGAQTGAAACPACPPFCCSVRSAWALDTLIVTLHRAEPEGSKRNLPSKPPELNLVLIACSVCCVSSFFVPEAASQGRVSLLVDFEHSLSCVQNAQSAQRGQKSRILSKTSWWSFFLPCKPLSFLSGSNVYFFLEPF